MMLSMCSVLTYCSCSVNKAPGKLDKLIYTCSANTNQLTLHQILLLFNNSLLAKTWHAYNKLTEDRLKQDF